MIQKFIWQTCPTVWTLNDLYLESKEYHRHEKRKILIKPNFGKKIDIKHKKNKCYSGNKIPLSVYA